MVKEDIVSKVREIVAVTINLPVEQITESLSIGEIQEWNSMANIAIVAAVEDEFNIQIPEDDLFEMTGIQNISEEVEKVLGSHV